MEDDFDIESPDIKIENESLDNLLGTIVSEMKEGAEESEITEQFECPICGSMVDIDADVCPSCGAVFVEDESQFECPVCGTLVDADALFCPKCGARFVEEEPEFSPEATEEVPEEAPAAPSKEEEPEPQEPVPAVAAEEEVVEEPEVSEPEPEPPLEEAPAPAPETTAPGEESPFLKKMKELRKGEAERAPAAPQREERAAEPEKAAPPAPEERKERAGTPLPKERAESRADAKEKYRRLPVLVSKVKPLLIIARQHNINVKKGKELIDKAVAAGRNRQIDDAINYITESRKLLEESLTIYANHAIAEIETDLPDLRAPDDVKRKLESTLEDCRKSLAEQDFDRAFQRLEIARRVLKEHSGDFQEARQMLSDLENTILDAEYFFMDVSRPKELLADAKSSAESGDWATAGVFAREGLELMDSILPELIKKEMKKARNVLMEAKMQGRDISKVISILKHASIANKSGNYGDALKYIKLFKAEMKR